MCLGLLPALRHCAFAVNLRVRRSRCPEIHRKGAVARRRACGPQRGCSCCRREVVTRSRRAITSASRCSRSRARSPRARTLRRIRSAASRCSGKTRMVRVGRAWRPTTVPVAIAFPASFKVDVPVPPPDEARFAFDDGEVTLAEAYVFVVESTEGHVVPRGGERVHVLVWGERRCRRGLARGELSRRPDQRRLSPAHVHTGGRRGAPLSTR